MKKSALLLVIAGIFAAGSAAAVGVTADLGTTGLGAHVSVPVNSSMNARFGINGLNYNHTGSASNVDYDFKLKLFTVDALLDWFPMDNGFRVTGGIVYNGNKVDANAKPTGGTYTINGTPYVAATAGNLNGNVDFRKLAPYVGLGWGNAAAKDKGWGFSADLGVLYQGNANTSLTNTGCTAGAAICNQLAADLARENANLKDKADKLRFYPVIRVGLSYKF